MTVLTLGSLACPIDLWALSSQGFAPRPLRAVRPVEPPEEATDEALMLRVAQGDRDAFDDLFERHADAVYRRLTRLIGPDADREDLVQEIFVITFKSAPRFRGDARFSTWLYRVVVNVAFDHLRRRKRRPDMVDADEVLAALVAEADPESDAAAQQSLTLAMTFLDRLSPKKRIAFVLRVVEGMSLVEIGALVGARAPTVGARVRHAQAELEAMAARAARRAGEGAG